VGDNTQMESFRQEPKTPDGEPPRRHSLTTIFAEHWPRLTRFVRDRCGNVIRRKESASDIAQSVCREALEHWSRFRGNPAELRQWLFQIARRKIIDRGRYWNYDKREIDRETGMSSAFGAVSPDASPSADAMGDEQANQLADALMELDDRDRDIILLARCEQVALVDIAEHYRCTEVTARKQLSRALARLEHLLRTRGF